MAPGEPGRPAYEVAFIDWGNTETVPASAVRPMGPALRAVEPQAAPASLAFLKARAPPPPPLRPGSAGPSAFYTAFWGIAQAQRPPLLGLHRDD